MSQLIAIVAKPQTGADTAGSDESLFELAGRVSPPGFSPLIERFRQGRLLLVRITPVTGAPIVTEAAFEDFSRYFDHFLDAAVGLDEQRFHLDTGEVAWRTAWWCEDDRFSFISTSLHAASFLLGDFEPDGDALASFLLRGSLGPVRSHDRRVQQIPHRLRLVIDLQDGRCTLSAAPPGPEEAASPRSDATARRDLEAAIRAVLARKVEEDSRWVVPLSGGVDSRGILLLSPVKLSAISWGTRETRLDRHSDSSLAARVAEAWGAPHQFIDIEPPDVPVGAVIDTFAWASEGRTDGINAYLDACAMWSDLARMGITCLLRGDQSFADTYRVDESGTRRVMGLADPSNIEPTKVVESVAARSTLWTTDRRAGESVGAFRDRVYRTFRLPSTYAALTAVKAQFVDVVCPLLAPEVARVVASFSDRQRTDKRVYREMIGGITPPIPFAPRNVFYTVRFADQPGVWEHLLGRARTAESLGLPGEVIEYLEGYDLTQGPSSGPPPRGVIRRVTRRVLPESLVRKVARVMESRHVVLEAPQLALRIVLAEEARRVFREDAEAGDASWPRPLSG